MKIEDIQPDETGSKPITEDVPKSRSALSRLKRELSDDELASTGVQKLLLDSLMRAEEACAALDSFREKYYQTDKQNGILQEKLKTSTAFDVVSIGSLAVGTAAMGYAPSVWTSQPTFWIVLVFGVVLTGVGIAARVVRR